MRLPSVLGILTALGAGCPDFAGEVLSVAEDVPAPVVLALAGADLTVLEGSRVLLNGAASRGSGGGPVRLVWTQVEGPPVSLTNASAPTPSFVAPLAPADLVFSLAAEGVVVDIDTVKVTVASTPAGPAGFIEVPADAIAAPLADASFVASVIEADLDVTLRARSDCGVEPEVSGFVISLTLPDTLPCAVIIDGEDSDGRGLAPAARVFWPAGAPLPNPTRLAAGSVVVPPASSVAIAFEDLGALDQARTFGADGTAVLPDPVAGEIVLLTAPRRAGRLVLGGEVLRDGASGGVRYALVDVGSGSANTPPIARGGPDRIVQPGARFRIDTAASFDADGDELVVTSTQVLGAPATPELAASQVFFAPSSQGTLLFHVVADDAVVLSAPDPVRVVVDDGAENLRPVLTLAPERYVRPGQTFVIDASGAQDPDSGFIASFLIVQDEADPLRLLGEPLTTSTASFVAQSAGDIYNFHVSAFDEGGLGTTVDVAVIVEDAGPYVDPVRGDDSAGNGTAATPFATIAAALPTAARHAFDALLLAEGIHAAPPTTLPAGLDFVGGYRFGEDSYDRADDAETRIAIEAPTLLSGSRLDALFLDIASSGSIHLSDGALLLNTQALAAPGPRTQALVAVLDGSHARLDGALVDASSSTDAAALAVGVSSIMALVGSTLVGGAGVDAVALACDGGTVVIDGGALTGTTADAERSTALKANACVVVISAATLAGGSGATATGMQATSSLVTADATSALVGRTVAGGTGVGASIADDMSPAMFEGTVSASSFVADAPLLLDDATGLVLFGARVELLGARVYANAPSARGVFAVGGALSATETTVEARGESAVAVILDSLGVATFHDGAITAADPDSVAARVENPAAMLSLIDTVVTGAAAGILASSAHVTLQGASVAVTGASAAAPIGLLAASASILGATVWTAGVDAVAVELVAPSTIERSSIRIDGTGTTCAAIRASGALDLISTFVEATEGGCAGIDQAAGALSLTHVTVLAGTAVVWREGLTLHNSVLSGTPALVASGSAPFGEAIGVAFANVAPLALTSSGPLTDIASLEAAGCDLCFAVDLTALVDDGGHLTAGDNALVDAADPAVSTELDIDGEQRPAGGRPDLGCDER